MSSSGIFNYKHKNAMTKDEITKALSETQDGTPSGLVVDWAYDNRATVTLPSGKTFVLKKEIGYFSITVTNYCMFYGNKLRVDKHKSGYILVHHDGIVVANISL